ncbi:MAG: hypothetical protein A3E88_08095 [Legionellales bacterium RIFCSPHIGHO2_12_FULL_35_11]|nr:MAG: hypothetical protein A3E88_08095 [Legionellales bacterium RIFCSPHIGHO2_12_FULL_35_11]
MSIEVKAFKNLYNRFESSFFMRLFFPSLFGTLQKLDASNNLSEQQSLYLLSFQQANTTLFYVFTSIVNFFYGATQKIDFFEQAFVRQFIELQEQFFSQNQTSPQLKEKIFYLLASSDNPLDRTLVVYELDYKQILSEKWIDKLIACKNAKFKWEHICVLSSLQYNNINFNFEYYLDVLISHKDPQLYIEALSALNDKKLLQYDECKSILSLEYNSISIAKAIILFEKKDLLTAENVKKIPQKGDVFCASINSLNDNELLDSEYAQDYLDAMVAFDLPTVFVRALVDLKNKGILDKDNFTSIKSHAHPNLLANALIVLNTQNLLDKDTRSLVSQKIQIKGKGIDEKNKIALAELSEKIIYGRADAIIKLKEANIFCEENIEAVMGSCSIEEHPSWTANNLVILHESNLLNDKNKTKNIDFAKKAPGYLLKSLFDKNLLSNNGQGMLDTVSENMDVFMDNRIENSFVNVCERWDDIIGLLQDRDNSKSPIVRVCDYLDNIGRAQSTLYF